MSSKEKLLKELSEVMKTLQQSSDVSDIIEDNASDKKSNSEDSDSESEDHSDYSDESERSSYYPDPVIPKEKLSKELSDVVKALRQLSEERETKEDYDSDDKKSNSEDNNSEVSDVLEALRRSSKEPKTISDEEDSDLDDKKSNSEDNNSESENLSNDSRTSEQSYFYVEDIIPSEDFKLKVETVGELKFPIEDETIRKLLQISSKAKFGKGETTVLDTNFRDTQVIPADKLTVNIEESALAEVLERTASGLNIDKESALEIHLHNMLIYGPGQFFKKHRDSEKLPNMVATLVIVLPTQHKGGDLIIEHNGTKHKFFGSKKSIKCIAFYADCNHKIQKVTEGYRVALTYNVVVKFSPISNTFEANESLDKAVSNYFNSTGSLRLVYLLNHMYTEHSLRWQMMKGSDRTRAQALLAVAKKQARIPFLALAMYHVHTDANDRYEREVETSLDFWINDINMEVAMTEKDVLVSENEICYTIRTDDFCDPCANEDEGSTGNEGHPIEKWYRRACVVLWADKWSSYSEQDFKNSLAELENLMNQSCDKSIIQHEINTNSNGFFNFIFWFDKETKETLFNMVKYLGITEESLKILMRLSPKEVFTRVSFTPWIENLNDLSAWSNILRGWSKKFLANDLFDSIIPFMKKKITSESDLVFHLMEEIIKLIPNMRMTLFSSLFCTERSSYFSKFHDLLHICNSLKNESLENKLLLTENCKEILKNAEHFFDLEKTLPPNQFKRVFLALKLDLKEDVFKNIDEFKSYSSSDKGVKMICGFYKVCIKFEENSLVAELLKKIIKKPPTFIKECKDYNSLVESIKPEHFPSTIGERLLKNVIDNCTSDSYAFSQRVARNNPNDYKVKEVCSLFKICVNSNFTSSIMTLKKYILSAKSIFTPICTANLIIKLKETLTTDQFDRFNDLKSYAAKLIKHELNQFETIIKNCEQIKLNCSCANCKKVDDFLKSRDATTLSIWDDKKNRKHVEQEIDKIQHCLRQHVRVSTPYERPHVLEISKPKTDEALLNELRKYKNKLSNITSSALKVKSSAEKKRKRAE